VRGELCGEAIRLFGSSRTDGERSTCHVEAAIALCHVMAPDVEHTDWPPIVELYHDLLALRPSPVAALNRAIAAAMAGEPDRRELARLEYEPARLPPAARRPRRAVAAGRQARDRRRLLPRRPHQAGLHAHPAVPRTTARPVPEPPGRVIGGRGSQAVDNQVTSR
jgi:hypothetical protein